MFPQSPLGLFLDSSEDAGVAIAIDHSGSDDLLNNTIVFNM